MRIKFASNLWLKTCVFLTVVLLTWIASSPLRAQIRFRFAVQGQKSFPPFPHGLNKIPIAEAQAEQLFRGGIARKPIASTNLRSFDLADTEDGLQISAQADVFETRPKKYYVWSLRILSKQNDLVFPRAIYDDFPIKVDASNLSKAEFFEIVPLGPGDYNIEISMHEFDSDLPKNQIIERPSADTITNECFAKKKSIHIE